MTDKPQWTGTTTYLREGGIPCYDYPEMAARALAALTRYNSLRSRKKDEVTVFDDVDRAKAKEIIGKESGTGRLGSASVYEILKLYVIPVVRSEFAGNAEEAVAASKK